MAGKFKVAYFYEEPNNSTFRYRAYNMAQALNIGDKPEISASYFFFSDFDCLDQIVDSADLLVICRSRYSSLLNEIITKFKVRGKKVLFDIDDFVFNPAYAHLIAHSLNLNFSDPSVVDNWFAYTGRMGEALRLCDGAITTNDFLAEKITEFSGISTAVVPNFMNNEQLVISEKLYKEKKESHFLSDGRITLGYFSGSPSHALDFDIAASGLDSVMSLDERIDLLVVGYIDPGENLKKYGKRVKYHPFVDYINLQRFIASVEINLMPLQSNIFTQCKSELKYFEAAIVGTVSIASPVGNYLSAINDKVTGYHSKAHEWASKIEYSINNLETYSDVASISRDEVSKRYTNTSQLGNIYSALMNKW